MTKTYMHTLAPVRTREQWRAYHDMRRRILWENRGRYGVYEENHPDEYKPGNHPMLLLFRGEPIGVVRIDVDYKAAQAIMRRIAITEIEQRRGHGRVLIQLVEEFSTNEGCCRVIVASAEDAQQFYEKCGYKARAPGAKQMWKDISECEARVAIRRP